MRSAERSPDGPGSARTGSGGDVGGRARIGRVGPLVGADRTPVHRRRSGEGDGAMAVMGVDAGADPGARDWMAAGRVTAAVR